MFHLLIGLLGGFQKDQVGGRREGGMGGTRRQSRAEMDQEQKRRFQRGTMGIGRATGREEENPQAEPFSPRLCLRAWVGGGGYSASWVEQFNVGSHNMDSSGGTRRWVDLVSLHMGPIMPTILNTGLRTKPKAYCV